MSRINDPAHEFVWDGLDLLGDNEFEGQWFTLEALNDGSSWGAAEPVETWVRAMLLDGSIGSRSGDDNRTVTFPIRVSGESGQSLQAGETALKLAQIKTNTLAYWTPPDSDSATTVFEVRLARMRIVTDFDAEMQRERVYELEWVCHPFTRSVDEVYEEAVPPAGSAAPTVLDECTATTNWSSPDGSVAVYGGQAVSVSIGYMAFRTTLTLERSTLNLTDATRPYLRVKWNSGQTGSVLVATVAGVDYPAVGAQGGYSWFAIPDVTAAPITFKITFPPSSGSPASPQFFRIWQLAETANVGLGTRRELTRTLAVRGSARTMGRLTVSHPSTGLGNVLVFTYPDTLAQYAPPMATFRTAGGSATVDAATVSGTREPLNGTPTYTVPAASLPSGFYRIVARMRHTSATTVTCAWNAAVAGITVNGSGKIKFDAVSTWQFVTIDAAALPPVQLADDSESDVVFKLDPSGVAPAGVELDALWLFHTDGVITMVSAGSEKTVIIESASPEWPAGMLWTGDHYPGANAIQALGRHDLSPPLVLMHTVTDGTEDATVGLNHFPRWHTHAGI